MVTRESGFYQYMKFRHEIKSAEWRDEEGMWTLSVKDINSNDIKEEKVHVFLELNGPVRYAIPFGQPWHTTAECCVLSSPRITPLKGIDAFKGEVIHPAYWDDKVTVENKRVALIGYGCETVSTT